MYILFIITLLIRVASSYFSYENYHHFTINFHKERDLGALSKLNSQFGDDIDFFIREEHIGGRVQFFVNHLTSKSVHSFLKTHNASYTYITKDSWIDSSFVPKRKKRSVVGDKINLNVYHSYDDFIKYLFALKNKYKNMISIKKIGKSYEGRSIYTFTIGYQSDKTKPIIFLESGIHAREWITQSSLIILIDYIMKNSDKYNDIFKDVDIVIVPCVNPDGYEYSRRSKRMWRGNRNITKSQSYGVDLNRNFPTGWNVEPDHFETYPGVTPSSELETTVIIDFLTKNKKFIKGFLSLHSYGRYLLLPWNYKKNHYPPEYKDTYDLGKKMIESVRNKTKSTYELGTGADLLYPSNGVSTDFARSIGIKYAYTIEFLPSSNYTEIGFIVPEKMIPLAGEELKYLFIPFLEHLYGEYIKN